MNLHWILSVTALAFVYGVAADIYSFHAAEHIAYSIAVLNSAPDSAVFFQIIAPITYEWVALGQGTQMAGSNIFVIYSSSPNNDNVTLSPRAGIGHIMPEYNAEAQVHLLDGSGISDGYMTANVRCDSCLSRPLDRWIWAAKRGNPIGSTDETILLPQHDLYGRQSVDLANATITNLNTSNPFADYNGSAATADAISSSGSAPSTAVLIAHGTLMSASFLILFPAFAISLHIIPSAKTVPRIHAPLQLSTLCIVIAGFALGIYLAVTTDQLATYHAIIGFITISSLMLFQPASGLIQHTHFRRTGGKSSFALLHRWLGRTMLVLGIINGGLGIRLVGIGEPGNPTSLVIIHSAIAGVSSIVYIVILAIKPAAASKASEAAMMSPQIAPRSGKDVELRPVNPQ
ncbi:hypothetical protein BJX63DRAFT_397986 [Aspergillus granulosus]|uniref:Cytochrome b561 domain-containing protein n=1 Tax=Aspergillus granulosus TaxID=176169 RepID=A0ABR4H982_9EURO